ncbi:ABC transporter permease [Tundrisphaera sp. TA3]|uniref:ABC transporter permease n=1 Tax=Tundrisphaera sp. TA3 TaxID=3435775 RepID=UPI003EBB43DD
MKTIGPDWWGLAWASLPMAVGLALLSWQRLGQVRPMLIATARLVGQMMLLAVSFGAIVAADSAILVVAVAALMLGVAAHTVASRMSSGRRVRVGVEAFAAMALGSVVVLAVSSQLALKVQPWYDARVILPLLGMILGNCVTAVALAAERLDADLEADRDLVERCLSLGASPRQAATPALRAAVAAGLTPIINNMMIAGIVAIPGMTTGQILAGADVGSAVRYQILMYLGIAGTTTIGVQVLLWSRLRRAFTHAEQLRRPEERERPRPRPEGRGRGRDGSAEPIGDDQGA